MTSELEEMGEPVGLPGLRARGGQGQGAGPPLTLSVLLVTRGPRPPPVPPPLHVLGPGSVACLCVTGGFLSLPSALLYLCFSVPGLWGLYVSPYHGSLSFCPPTPSSSGSLDQQRKVSDS